MVCSLYEELEFSGVSSSSSSLSSFFFLSLLDSLPQFSCRCITPWTVIPRQRWWIRTRVSPPPPGMISSPPLGGSSIKASHLKLSKRYSAFPSSTFPFFFNFKHFFFGYVDGFVSFHKIKEKLFRFLKLWTLILGFRWFLTLLDSLKISSFVAHDRIRFAY